jgi:hypothetical protein
MSVYVDDPIWTFGRMKMCHMIADTKEELLKMADAIGVSRKWIQKENSPNNVHFDICKSMRAKAVKLGAIEKNMRDMPWLEDSWECK